MHNKAEYDVVVIGGGASGLMAAASASLSGRRVLLLEKNPIIGKKLSITGGGRCNILNAEADTRVLLAHYGEAAKFLHSPFSAFGMQAAWDWFETNGLPLKVEAGKRAFPVSCKASDVVLLFERFLKKNGVIVQTGVSVKNFVTETGGIVGVTTSKGIFTASAYILATGGLSHTHTGSTGEGHTWLEELGHTVHHPNPSLVPLLVQDSWIHELAGVSLTNVEVRFTPGPGAKMAKPFSRRGKLLFTHFGLSGPVILNAASEVQKLLVNGNVTATIDLWPEEDVATVDTRLLSIFDEHKNKVLKNVLKHVVPQGMSRAILSAIPPQLHEQPVHSVTKEERRVVAEALKTLTATITGTKGNDWAVVSDGGLDLHEVDTKTMRSKRYLNLYVTGDVLHISRPTGGYSLQLCWTTGYVAGQNV